MKKWLAPFAILGSVSLSACSVSMTADVVNSYTLPNGTEIHNGTTIPEDSWGCKSVAQSTVALNDKGFWDWLWYNNNDYGYMAKVSGNYAADNKLNTNYIFFKVPTKVGIANVSARTQNTVMVTYFKCKVVNP
jgi:hypothetical protein